MKKLWYKLLNKLIGAFVREEVSLYHIEMGKAVETVKAKEVKKQIKEISKDIKKVKKSIKKAKK